MQTQVDSLLSRIFKAPFFWAKDSIVKIIILLAGLYIFVFPIAQWLQNYIKKIPFINIVSIIYYSFINLFSVGERILFLISVILILIMIYVIREINKSKYINENFNHGLNLWNIPFNAGWSTQKCEDANGNMLTITQSNLVGLLKPSHSWYDYELSFQTKISTKNEEKVLFAIRADNNSNAVIFELTKSSLNPYLLYNGKLILDSRHMSKFSLVLNENIWFKVKVSVVGNDVEIMAGEGNKVNYKLPVLSVTVEESVINGFLSNPTLEQILENNTKWRNAIDTAIRLGSDANKITDPLKSKEKLEEADKAWESVPKNTTYITFDFSKGSIGFISPGSNKSYIRKLRVKKI